MLRTGLAAVLLILFVPTVVAANTSLWAVRTILDGSVFSATIEQTLDTPEMEHAVAAAIGAAIVESLAGRPGSLAELAGPALGLPAGSTREQVEEALDTRILGAIRTPTVHRVRDEIVASVHDVMLNGLEAAPGIVTIRGKDVVLDTDRLIERIAATNQGIAAAVDQSGLGGQGSVVIARAAEIQVIGRALAQMEATRLTGPLVAGAMALLIVVIAHRRVRALGLVGWALVAAGLVSFAVIWLTGQYVPTIPEAPLARRITGGVLEAFLEQLRYQTIALVLTGVAVVAAAQLLGRRQRRRAVARMLGPRG
jgi:hypothetical protein